MRHVFPREGSEILTESEFLAKYYPAEDPGVDLVECAMKFKYMPYVCSEKLERLYREIADEAPFEFMFIMDDDRIYVGRPPILETNDSFIVHEL
jgi:hypothetical protein